MPVRLCFSRWLLGWALVGPAAAQQYQLPAPRRQLLPPPDLNLVVNRMTEDARGHLWLATDGGLGRFDGQRLESFHAPQTQPDDVYATATATPDGRVWLLLHSGQLARFDPARRTIARLPDSTRLVRQFVTPAGVRSLFVDRQGQLWLGLRGRGLVRVNPRTLDAEHVFRQPRTVHCVAEGPDGRVWFTSDSGLYALDRRSGRTQGFFHDPQNPQSLGSNATRGLSVRPDGRVLVSLQGIGEVDVLDPATGRVRRVALPRSPRAESAQWTDDLRPDSAGNAYFSAGWAVFRLTTADALQRIELPRPAEGVHSVLVSRSGKLYVNAGGRLDEYDLGSLRPIPPLHLVDVVINGSRLVENPEPTEDRLRRDAAGQLRLRVREGDVVQLYVAPSVERRVGLFRTRLDPHDRQWVTFNDSLALVTYQPPAGRYTFWFNRARPGGGWAATSTAMAVEVVPPFYKTGWFLALVAVAVGAAGVVGFRAYARRQRLQRELARREGEAANLRQLDRLKSDLFANLTHEFRTPLTLILAATDQLGQRVTDGEGRERLASVERNARQLLRLITQLLDTAKLDSGQLAVQRTLGDPAAFVGQLVASYETLAEKKGIALRYEAPDTGRHALFDHDKLEMMGHNLLANALKFTPEGGVVDVRCTIYDLRSLMLNFLNS